MKNEILRRLSALALGLALLLNAAPLPQAFAVEDDTDASSSDSADSTDTTDKTVVTTADSDPTVTAAAANAPALDATAALFDLGDHLCRDLDTEDVVLETHRFDARLEVLLDLVLVS